MLRYQQNIARVVKHELNGIKMAAAMDGPFADEKVIEAVDTILKLYESDDSDSEDIEESPK